MSQNHSSVKWQAGSTLGYHRDHNCSKPTYLEAAPRMLTSELGAPGSSNSGPPFASPKKPFPWRKSPPSQNNQHLRKSPYVFSLSGPLWTKTGLFISNRFLWSIDRVSYMDSDSFLPLGDSGRPGRGRGQDTLRPSDNGALCGGGVFETPGCVHNQCCLIRDMEIMETWAKTL